MSQTLQFYTTGEAFTPLMRSLIEEGKFYNVHEVLLDGGAPEDLIKDFFNFKAEFVGDTRDEKEGLVLKSCEPVYDDKGFKETYLTALRTLASELDVTLADIYIGKKPKVKKDKHLIELYKIFTHEQIKSIIFEQLIENEGYGLNPSPLYEVQNGVIISTGDLITCGYQEHISLYPFLLDLGLVNSGYWTHDNTAFHISSGQISGDLANALENPDLDFEETITDAQLQTLFKYRKSIKRYGYRSESATKMLLRYIGEKTNKGGKYNNLLFLKTFYADKINLPNFDLNKLEGVANQCIRTSPRYSIPGLLHSKYNVTDYDKAVAEIKADFENFQKVAWKEKYINGKVAYTNEIHWFFQEYLEGGNGVANYRGKGQFSYAYSDEQGAIVEGKKSNTLLDLDIVKKLRKILGELYEDLEYPIQVEFVVDKQNKLYIIQLRLLENEPKDNDFEVEDASKVVGTGHAFSCGFGEYKLEDVLVIDSDCESEALLGKKALIVRGDVEFSHALALSKVLRIPSVYGVGDVKLPEKFNLNTVSKTGVIYVS